MSMIKQTPSLIAVPNMAMSDDEFKGIANSTKYLPRIQIFGGNSKLVNQKKISSGHYGLVTAKDTVINLGEQFDCLPVNVRPKAMDLSKKPVISVFDSKSEMFSTIKAASTVKGSKCMFGPEFLVWIPAEHRFGTMFFGNPTMRRCAPEMKDLIGYATTCQIQFIETEEYSWHGPVIVQCSTPFDLPSDQEIQEQNELFLAKEPVIETVEDEDESASARPR